jgi:hypothetical protein
MGPEAQCGLPALHLHNSTIHHLGISCLVAQLSGGCAKKILSTIQRLFLEIAGAIRIIPTLAMKELTCLPAVHLVTDGEARSAAHRLWSLGCWLPSPQSMAQQHIDAVSEIGSHI